MMKHNKESITSNCSYQDPPFQTKEEKIARLGLSEERIQQLKEMPVKEFDKSILLKNNTREYKVIDVDKLVGFTNCHFINNWYEALDVKVLHKPLTLKKFDLNKITQFDEYLLADNYFDPPSVVEYEGEYYVDGDGTHRLTVAKLLGGKKAKVIVKNYNNN